MQGIDERREWSAECAQSHLNQWQPPCSSACPRVEGFAEGSRCQVSGGRWLIVSAGRSGIRVSVRLDVAYAGGGRGMCCSVQVHVHYVHACSLYGNLPHCIVSLLS